MTKTIALLQSSLLALLLLTSCSEGKNHLIAKIPEASGVSFCQKSNTLIVVNDEGWYYELSLSGQILSQYKLGKYDLEGVVCEENLITFADEDGLLLQVNRTTLEKKVFKIKKDSQLKGDIFRDKNSMGIEGIVKIKGLYYLAIQANKKKNSNLLVVKLGANYAKVIKIINHKIKDSSGLEYRGKKLYILSDDKDKLYVYDLKREKVLKKIKLPKFAQEGIAFDNNGAVYFADDNGRVLKESVSALGL